VNSVLWRTVCANQLRNQPNCVVSALQPWACVLAGRLTGCAPRYPQRPFTNYVPPRLRQNCKIWPV